MWWWLLIACSRSHDYVKRTSSRFSLCGATPWDSFRLWCGQLDYQAVHVPDIPRQNLKSPQGVALQSGIRLLVRSTQTRPWLYIPECSFLFIRSIKERFALTDALLLLKLHSMIAVYNSNCSIKDMASEACRFLILLRETSVWKVPLPPPTMIDTYASHCYLPGLSRPRMLPLPAAFTETDVQTRQLLWYPVPSIACIAVKHILRRVDAKNT